MSFLNLLDEVRRLIGPSPPGYEFVEYVFVGFFLVLLVLAALSLLRAVFNWIGGF